jgi:hypothetical protein
MSSSVQIKTQWPWITCLVALAAALNPIGYDIIRQAFTSGEQLARTLGQLVVYSALGIAAVVAVIEFGIRKFLIARQRQLASGVANG